MRYICDTARQRMVRSKHTQYGVADMCCRLTHSQNVKSLIRAMVLAQLLSTLPLVQGGQQAEKRMSQSIQSPGFHRVPQNVPSQQLLVNGRLQAAQSTPSEVYATSTEIKSNTGHNGDQLIGQEPRLRSYRNMHITTSRVRRSSSEFHGHRHHRGMQRRSCKTISKYVARTEAEDVFGNTVKLHPYIQVGDITVSQYLHESFCDVEHCKCTGTDSNTYTSSCETEYRMVLARVIINGQNSWTLVKARSGCSCLISKKATGRQASILDLL